MDPQPLSQDHGPSSHRLPIVLLVLLALAFNWFYLLGDFQGDDFIFFNMFREDPLPYDRLLGPWSIGEHPCFQRLWWCTSESFSGAFWRPLPGLVLEGSYRLFGGNAFPLHLLSLVLHAGVAACVYLLVFRLAANRGLAFLAGLFFVACEDHSMVIGWITTLTDLICVLAVLLSLLAWLSWLRRRTLPPLILSLLLLAVALGSKESAAAAPFALALLGILMPGGKDTGPLDREGIRMRLRGIVKSPGAWLPPMLVLAAYLVVYTSLGVGGFQSLVYVNPLTDPLGYLGHLAPHLPVMWLATLTPVMPSVIYFMPGLLAPLALTGAICGVLFVVALLPFRRSALVVWALIVYLAALLPQMGTDASERLLYLPMAFAAILLAIAAARIGPLARRIFGDRPEAPRFTRIAGWWCVLIVLLPGVLLSASMPYYYMPSFERPARDVCTVMPHIEGCDPAVILVNAPNPFITLYTGDILTWYRGTPTEVWLLAAPNARMSIERTGERSFVLRADRPGWLTNMFARLVRSESTLRQDRVYDREHFSATLVELTRGKTDVLAVRFEMKKPFDDPETGFFHWDGRAYVPLGLSALAIGETMDLADTSDIWKSM